MRRTRSTSPQIDLAISSSLNSHSPGSVAPPAKLVKHAMPSGARPGKSDEFQTVPRTRNPSLRGTRNPNPLFGC